MCNYHRMRTLKNKQWFNGNCSGSMEIVKKQKRTKKRHGRNFRKTGKCYQEKYKIARNRYVEVRRTAQKKYEQRVVENCDSNLKMFYKFINGKLNKREAIEKVKVWEEVSEDARDIACNIEQQLLQCLQRRSILLEKGLWK